MEPISAQQASNFTENSESVLKLYSDENQSENLIQTIGTIAEVLNEANASSTDSSYNITKSKKVSQLNLKGNVRVHIELMLMSACYYTIIAHAYKSIFEIHSQFVLIL